MHRVLPSVSIVASCLVTLIIATTLSAASIPMSDLLSGGELFSRSLRFSEFTYTADDGLPVAAEVAVLPIRDTSGNPGLRFELNLDSDLASGVVSLSYVVEQTISAPKLQNARMTGDPSGGGLLSVSQQIAGVGSNFIFARSGTSRTFDELFRLSAASLAESQRHEVATIINVRDFGRATLTSFEQSFALPEPSSSLLVAMLAGVCLSGRSRVSRWHNA